MKILKGSKYTKGVPYNMVNSIIQIISIFLKNSRDNHEITKNKSEIILFRLTFTFFLNNFNLHF